MSCLLQKYDKQKKQIIQNSVNDLYNTVDIAVFNTVY